MKYQIVKVWIDELKELVKKGFFYIFASQIINKIIVFGSSILIIRILSKTDFGIYSYANNIVSIFLLLNGLGAISGLLQFGCENRDNPQKLAAYSSFAWKMGLFFNTVICMFIVVFALFFNFKFEGAEVILLSMALQPMVSYIYSQIEIGFRIRLQNKEFSALSMLNSSVLMIGTIIGAYYFGIIGIVLLRYAGFIISIIVGNALANRYGHIIKDKIKLTQNEKKNFFKLSFISSLNNGISQMLYLLDIFLIGIIIPNMEIIASYKTATIIPFAMLFIPMTIITFIYPYFASHNKDRKWIRHRYNHLLKRLVFLNGFITVSMYIGAPWIVKYIFGADYMDSVEVFQILSIGYFIAATFRIPSGNILVCLHRVAFNFYNAVVSGVVNIVLNIILITEYGSIGAAYATVIVYIISALISTVYLNKILNDASKPLVV
jgi:O-antigen/teichoic acid export membrane protein